MLGDAAGKMDSIRAEVVFPIRAQLGEGSLWDPETQRLWWVDILQNKVSVFDPRNRSNLAFDVAENVGTVVLSEDDSLIVALRSGIHRLDPESGATTRLGVVPECGPKIRCNDGKCDPRGRFWVGTIVEGGERGSAALHRLDADLTLSTHVRGVTISNGLVWSRDARRFFYTDTATQRVDVFDFDVERGTIANRRLVTEIPKQLGSPDGMAIDNEDQLWVALWAGSKVIRIDPESGRTTFEVTLPVPNVTSCAFGGRDLDELYITTARSGMDEERLAAHPSAGSLFHAKLPYRGVPSARFRSGL